MTRATGRLVGRVLALVAATAAMLCCWSVVAQPESGAISTVALAVFVILTADLATRPAQVRHACLAGIALTSSWYVADPTSAGGVFPGEVALPCALLTCAVVFGPIRATGWILAFAGVSALVLAVSDHPAVLRAQGLGLQLGMVVAAGTVSSVLHRTVTGTDDAHLAVVAELSTQAVLAERRRAQGEVTDVLHGSVSDALRAVRDGYLDRAGTRAICAQAHDRLRRAARW